MKDEEGKEPIKKNIIGARETQQALLNILEDVEEARARAVEERNKTLSIITNFVDGILVFDKENILSLINPTAESFFEIEATEVIGRPLLRLTGFPKFKELVNLLTKKSKGLFRKELKIEDTLILEVTTVPVKRGKENLGILVILHDITREREIEKLKTEFVSLAAHQLRTPLSAIKWTLKMILEGDLGKITDEQEDYLQKTYISNERMINLINDLLNVSRIEEGKYLYKPAFIQFEDLVQSVINIYEKEFKRKSIKFQFEKPKKKMPKTKIDTEKMSLAITNLLDNATRYTPSKGEITVSLKLNKNEIEFSIKDSGAGIPKDQYKRVFTKFFRATNIIRIDTEGSGLGLFIVKNVIEAHGGKIWFESEEKEGTTFYFSVPVKKEFEGSLENN